jgi:hypothetical protein
LSLKRVLSVLMLLLLVGCTRQAPDSLPTVTVHLFTPVPVPSTPTPIPSPARPTPTSTATATAGPFTPFPAKPAVDALKLRVGPGSLFDPLSLLYQTQTVTVLGKSPGGEWTLVETADETQGWVFSQLLAADQDLSTAPVTEPENAQLLRGRLTDASGLPISGAQFSLTQGTDRRTDAMTDPSGDFYAFLPEDTSGDWLVAYVAIACTSNAFADNTCAGYKPGYTGEVQPDSQPVSLPTNVILMFEWE